MDEPIVKGIRKQDEEDMNATIDALEALFQRIAIETDKRLGERY